MLGLRALMYNKLRVDKPKKGKKQSQKKGRGK